MRSRDGLAFRSWIGGALMGSAVSLTLAMPAAAQEAVSAKPFQRWITEDVQYIVDDREREAFERLGSDEERARFIEQFWERRDPTPGTWVNEAKEEHYRRIAYSNQRFGTDAFPGWRTDPGRIYIVYGPPDEVEAHPSGGRSRDGSFQNPAPYQIWGYRPTGPRESAMRLIFVDAGSTRLYTLVEEPQ